jgi:hypothetical protein
MLPYSSLQHGNEYNIFNCSKNAPRPCHNMWFRIKIVCLENGKNNNFKIYVFANSLSAHNVKCFMVIHKTIMNHLYELL